MLKFDFSFFKKLSAREKRLTIPTILTISRIILVPFIVIAMIVHHWGFAFWFFVIAALTDTVDGSLARLSGEKTFLGTCLDPVADKLLILSCFFTLAFVQSPLFTIPLWFVLLVLTKELIVIGGALIILLLGGRLNICPTWLGKITTVAQISFIIWLFACYFFHWLPIKTYHSMLGIVILLTLLSLIQYVRIGFHTIEG
jgi:cardiolipin synthase